MKANIIEIFNSIQGEGKYAGTKQIFVRFFECNMHCSWCDTPHSIGDTTRNFKELTLDDIIGQIKDIQKDTHIVSLTGGEPLLQADFIRELIPLLRKENLDIHLETNGVLPNDLEKIIDQVDVVAMDMKMPSSTGCREYWSEHEKFLNIAKQKDLFIKTVVTSDSNPLDIQKTVDIVAVIDPNILFIIQPNTFELGNGVMHRCHEFELICSKRLTNVRILPQMHKLLKVR